MKSKAYAGLDVFRMIAALLIIAIHTSPLSSFSDTGDFILTRIIARVAVPFFFMTSGFFLISRISENADKLRTFVKKTALIYLTAIVIYIPLNIYQGYFGRENLLPNILKDLFFDGTAYHLWYLPAVIIGGIISWYLVKKLDYKKAFIIVSALYAVGLFGDSYYGLVQNVPFISDFYSLLFQVFDYTRNGIFFAPLFFVLGGFIADMEKSISLKKSIGGTVICLFAMLSEGLVLHRFDIQRHDSMYIFLPFLMFFLFNGLLYFKGKRLPYLRTISLLVYILHPMIIVVIRMFAKMFSLRAILIDNSIVFYLCVSVASLFGCTVLTMLYERFKPKKKKRNRNEDRAYVELNLKNLEYNVSSLKAAMKPNCELMAVVKSNAYGHNAFAVTSHLNKIGVKAFAVATIDEGIELRKYGISGEILILGYTAPEDAKLLSRYDLTQTLTDYEYAKLLNEQGTSVKAHIKIDTGMHRLGFEFYEIENIISVFSMKSLKVTGMFTHLCCCDSDEASDREFTKDQIEKFERLVSFLQKQEIKIPKIHLLSSYGLINYPEVKSDYVRAGIILYGVLSSPDEKLESKVDLKPVLSLKSRVVMLRTVQKGEKVGYGRKFSAESDRVIAVVSIGYADGYPRNLSEGKGCVLINGHKAPVVGNICMDQLFVDVTDIPDVRRGTTVTLIGKEGEEEITAPAVAASSGTISNELLSRLGTRLKVVMKNE